MAEKYICENCGEVEDVWFCDNCGGYYCSDCTSVKSSDGNLCDNCSWNNEEVEI